MERRIGIPLYPRHAARPIIPSPPGLRQSQANSDGAINLSPSSRNTSSPSCLLREQDQFMPIANVIRIMRRILPVHAKISDDAKETIQECVSEFISFVTGEANERCQREQRKTITAEDLVWAMAKLGFDDYVEPMSRYLNKYRESESDKATMRGELQHMRRNTDFLPLPPPAAYAPNFNMGYQQGMGMYDPNAFGGYYNGSGSGSGSSSQNNFDPFYQFK